ncbi:MAG: chemotaxis protein CheB [Ilumatobacteraceae bacterium]
MSGSFVRVVVVEASPIQRADLVRVLEADGDIRVVGEAASATDAVDIVARCRPDVVTLDPLMPDGRGQFLIEQIMAETPTPILVISAAVDDARSPTTADAVAGGALLALAKPAQGSARDEDRLRRTVRTLRGVVVIRHPRGRVRPPTPRPSRGGDDLTVVAVAASAGGPPALATVLAGLDEVSAPVLVVQHIHPDFDESFFSWMERVSALPVVVAEHRQALVAGCVYIGPGGMHLRLGPGRLVELSSTPAAIHRPSADELFRSVAVHAGRNGMGVLLTGIGDDGAQGLLAISRAGGRTLGQDEASSAVFGMPRAAGRLGAVQQFLDPEGIARAISRFAKERPS